MAQQQGGGGGGVTGLDICGDGEEVCIEHGTAVFPHFLSNLGGALGALS